MRYIIKHPMLSDEFIEHLGLEIEKAVDFERDRERFFRIRIYNQQETHKINYTSQQLKKLRFGQI